MKKQQNIPSAALSVFTYDDALRFVPNRTQPDLSHQRQVMEEVYPNSQPTVSWARIVAVLTFISVIIYQVLA